MSVGVVTGIYSQYDSLKAPAPQTVAAEWVCVTDDPSLVGTAQPWRVICEPRPDLPARLAAKVPKCLPWWYLEGDHDTVIWMDGSCYFTTADALEHLQDSAAPEGFVSQFVHPARKCIYTEAEFSAQLPKYAHQPIREQAQHYDAAGHPADWGLWATGFIVYRTPRAFGERLGKQWLTEQVRWTNQDQISQAQVWRSFGTRPVELPGGLLANDFVAWTAHADGT